MRQIAVLGLGQFGSHLARTLVKFGCEVLAIDIAEERVDEIRDDVHRALVADVRNFTALESVITDAIDEAIISLGANSIEPSILCTLNVKRLGVSEIRSTARNDDHAQILRAVGATEVIFPEQETAVRTARRVANPDMRDLFALEDDYRIMEIVAPDKLVGKTLVAVDMRKRFDLLVLAVRKKNEKKFRFLPTPDTVISQDEVLMVLGRELDLVRFAGM